MLATRTRDSLGPLALMLVIAVGILAAFRIAYADTVAAAGQPAGFDLTTWIALGLAALGGVRVIVDALLAFFKAEAPLTKTLVDDHIRDSLEIAHVKLDKLAGTVNGLVDSTKPPGGIRVLPGTASMLVVLLLGIAGAGALTACTHEQRATLAHDAKATLINCTAQTIGATPGLDLATLAAIVNLTAAERLKCMTPTGLDWKCVEQDAIAQGVTLGGCALVAMVAAAAKAVTPTSGLVAADPAPPPGSVALASFRAQVAPGVAFHTASGDY